MAHTYNSIQLHIVFSTKERYPFLTPDVRTKVHAYLAGVARELRFVPWCIGGVNDHVHALLGARPDFALADAVKELKLGSTHWIHQTWPALSKFAWQRGYGAFSVSRSRVESVIRYIEGQEAHHRRVTFREEFLQFLEINRVPYDERYLWK